MRPHYLQLSAFGPFADCVEIDFDRLGEGGLFLMHGETGAGKTTVLDGLSFALYGRVPGVRGVGRLRSDHAAAATRTSVRLEVSIGGRRLRITRTPAQERPKLRGSGVTSEPAAVQLDEWDDAAGAGWRPRSTRVGEVDAELSDLLGMSAEQFHQVVLLPQGQFARFLHSDASERTQLLQRLFATDRFRRIEDWLAERRRQTKEALDEAHHRVRRLVARVAQVSGEREPDELPDLTWVTDRLERAKESAAAAVAAAETARARHEATQRRAAEVADLARCQQRRQAALDRQRAVDAAAGRVAAATAEVDAARRAAAVSEPLSAQARRAALAAQARGAAEAARSVLPEDVRAASVESLRSASASGRETLGRLTEAAQIERSVAAAASESRELSRSATANRRRIEELAALEAASSADRVAAELRVAAARQAAVAGPAARSAAERAADAVSAALVREARARDVVRLSEKHLAAREVAVRFKEQATALRVDRIDGMIAELARHLEDDTPCPVCGAVEHPDPSEVSGRAVSKADEEEAAASAETAQVQATAIGEQLAAARAARDAADDRLRQLGSEQAEVAQLREAEAAAAAAAQELAAAAGDLPEAEGVLSGLDEQDAARRQELTRLEEAVAAAGRQISAAEKRQGELRERLDALLAGASTVAEAHAETSRVVEAVDAAEAAALAAARAAEESREADHRADQAASEAGFESIAEARAALRDPDAIRRLDGEVRRAQEEAATVAALLADPELDVALEPAAPVSAAKAEAQQALTASREAEQRLATATHQVEQLTALERELAESLLALEPVAVAARRAKELADLAAGSGGNRLNMALSAYVLAARLEEVAEAASHRLRAMTQGRYTLMHSDASKGNGRSGLRLVVGDSWTGQDRDTATLSGGETFLASLALALGLAEVVTASAGGTPLEALFIDEGFGTLDEQTLDEVLDVLDGLREGGRLVGIVSHVPHLRDRIPSQLRVRKGSTGSTLVQRDGSGEESISRPAAAASSPPPPPLAVASPPPVVEVAAEPVSEQLALMGAD